MLKRMLASIPRVVVTALMVVAMLDMLAGVFLRYVMTKLTVTFDLPRIDFFWVEEVGEYTLIWLTFIGAAIGIRRGIHFSVHLITDRLPFRLRRVVAAVHYVLIAGLGVVIAVYGWQVSELNSQSFSPTLGLNLRWLYLSSVVGGVLITVYAALTVRDVWRGKIPGSDAGPDTRVAS